MIAPLRTLIVDDDVAVADIHLQFVDAHPGFVVVGEAQTGAGAIEQIARVDPEVMLLDFYLPDFSGLEVLRRLRIERSQRIEVIAVTAARDMASVREARASGVRHYLVKPFTAMALRERLDEVVQQHTAMRGSLSGGPLDQLTVDRILTSRPAQRGQAPKGLSESTLDRVTAALRSAGTDLSAAEVAERIGMSRVGARRYLEHLVARGQAIVEPRYGATGRPVHRYRSSS